MGDALVLDASLTFIRFGKDILPTPLLQALRVSDSHYTEAPLHPTVGQLISLAIWLLGSLLVVEGGRVSPPTQWMVQAAEVVFRAREAISDRAARLPSSRKPKPTLARRSRTRKPATSPVWPIALAPSAPRIQTTG